MNDEHANATADDGADGPPEPVVLDGGGRHCVQLLIELSRLVAGLPPRSVVHLIAADPAAPLDLPAWCHLTGHRYLGPVPGRDRPTYALRVSGEARPTNPGAPWHPDG
ncbi:sulfurtransferase TusA family protein [Streptosporangium sp. NPDC020145]|uniref:sulfurtransferase TusA family protein n=1 Tax=Streptosporangium sp. NPDC020145 TaxID=3154694 RepID=UPI003420C032